MKEKIEVECGFCGGTGLFMDCYGVNGGAAVVCHTCNGSGHVTMEYTPWNGKLKRRNGVKRVFDETYGYDIYAEDTPDVSGNTIHFSQYGCTYEEWLEGVKPRPIEELRCPFSYDRRMAQKACGCKNEMSTTYFIPDCSHFKDKAECWKKFNAKSKVKAKAAK